MRTSTIDFSYQLVRARCEGDFKPSFPQFNCTLLADPALHVRCDSHRVELAGELA
jgi:hypothetical protein